MLNFNMTELILILVIALVVFGPGKLPEIGKALGKGINEFKSSMTDISKIEPEKAEPVKLLDAANKAIPNKIEK